MFDVAYLIKEVITYDEIGQAIATEAKQKIFCTVGSITRAEWDVAGRHGYKPTFLLAVNSFEYDGEADVEYHEKKYSVYRTFTKAESNITELYLTEKAGDDNGDESIG